VRIGILRGFALAALLLGPLATGELWVRGQLDRLYPFLTRSARWPDAKMMLLERAGCPQVLALGSSVTNRTLVAPLVKNEALPFAWGEAPVESVFAFGLNGARMTHLYGAWRHVDAGGCTPAFVFIEVLPGVLNGRGVSRVLLRPFLDAATAWNMPRGFAREARLDALDVLEAATWGRLVLPRLRAPLLAAWIASWKASAPRAARLPLDGMIRPLSRQDLVGEKFAAQRAKRLRITERGEYRVRPSMVQVRALRKLMEGAAAAGSRVILHSPPVTSIYRKIVDQTNGHRVFCRLYEEVAARDGVAWAWFYDGRGFAGRDFMNWNHLNSAGGKRYVRKLFRDVRRHALATSGWCAAHLASLGAEAPPAAVE